MKDAPVFVYSGGQDRSMPPPNQIAQKDLVQQWNAKTKYVLRSEEGHSFPQEIIAEAIRYIYGNLPNSGINLSEPLKSMDQDWRNE